MKYSEEFKAEIIAAYHDRTTNASVFLSGSDIPRSTFYGWLQKQNAGQEKKREPKFTKAEYNNLQTRIANLESKIEILKTVNCTVHAPVKEMLIEIERLQCQYYDGNEQSKRVQEKLGFKYQWTNEKAPVVQLGEMRKGHVNLLTKEEWLANR